MAPTREILLLLGGNEGDPLDVLKKAEAALEAGVGSIISRSRHHWTEPWGFKDDRLFLNKALLLRSALAPDVLMQACLQIEKDLGRVRQEGTSYGPRPIDIDILMIEEEVENTPLLTCPHPQMHQRAFAMAPAADIAPHWRHPILQRTILQLLNDLLHRSVMSLH